MAKPFQFRYRSLCLILEVSSNILCGLNVKLLHTQGEKFLLNLQQLPNSLCKESVFPRFIFVSDLQVVIVVNLQSIRKGKIFLRNKLLKEYGFLHPVA
ncbi:hypothetical protein Csa_021263 [Cucumis sativus]|uniref:Uncharacterized protein n=1 Tax=Cucumis sativus TaxID=3659 RepID=A0A0A0LIY0_CUCSA|nr:hypothetical protein Csa_021263 [Cucumis sativus]